MDPSLFGIASGTTVNLDPTSAYPFAGSTGIASGTGTQQHGIAPLLTGGPMNAVNSVWEWLNKPFSTAISPVTVFAYVGAVIIAIILWNLLLYHIRIAAETI